MYFKYTFCVPFVAMPKIPSIFFKKNVYTIQIMLHILYRILKTWYLSIEGKYC